VFRFLLQNKHFTVYLITQGLSSLGDAVRAVVVPIVILQITRSPIWVAVLVILGSGSYFIAQLFLAGLLDHLDRRRLMLLADLGRGMLMLTVPLVWMFGGPVLFAALMVTAPLSILGALFDAGSGAVVPGLVEREQLPRAYSLFEAAEALAWVAGPLLAGAAAVSLGAMNALVIDGLSFFASACGIAAISLPPQVSPTVGRETLLGRVTDGFRFLSTDRRVSRIQLCWTLYGLIGYGAVTGLIFLGSRGGLSAGGLASVTVAIYAAGSIAGSLLAARFESITLRSSVVFSIAVFAVGAFLAAASSVIALAASAFLIGAGEGSLLVRYLSRRASSTPNELMARVGAAAALLARIAGGIAVAWMGFIMARWNGSIAFLVMGALALALLLFVALSGEVELAVEGKS